MDHGAPAIDQIGQRVGGGAATIGRQARDEGGGDPAHDQAKTLQREQGRRACPGGEIANPHARDLRGELHRRGQHDGALQVNAAMAGLTGDAHDRIDRAVAGRHHETAGDADQQGKAHHRPIREPVGEKQAGQRQSAQSGEDVEIEQDSAPVTAFSQDAGHR